MYANNYSEIFGFKDILTSSYIYINKKKLHKTIEYRYLLM